MYEETPTGYDLTMRKVEQKNLRTVIGLDSHLNIIGKTAGGPTMMKMFKLGSGGAEVNSQAILKEFKARRVIEEENI